MAARLLTDLDEQPGLDERLRETRERPGRQVECAGYLRAGDGSVDQHLERNIQGGAAM